MFYLERLQNKEPITTHVITIPRRNNGDERKLASGGIDSQDVYDWIERFELKTDLLIFESSAKLPNDETKRDQAVERLKRTYLL